MTGFTDDLRQALRGLWRVPGFTAAATVTLALGIGATTTLVSAMDALLFRPPVGVEEPQEIIRTYFRHENAQFGGWINSIVAYPDYTDLTAAKSLSGVAAQHTTSGSLGRGAGARQVNLLAVTGNYFQLLGARPLLGRLLNPNDDRDGNGTPALVLSEALWRGHFAADPAILGRTLPIDNQVFTVVGVALPGFDGGNYNAPEAWAPFSAMAGKVAGGYRTDRGSYFISLIGRLAPGSTARQAAAEATALISAGRSDSTVRNGFKEVLLGPVQEARGPDYSSSTELVYVLAAVSLIVLLIACANVANLLLVRGLIRGRELAIRKALGAGQARVARLLFLEGAWLALFAGLGGLLICQWGGDVLRRYVLPAGLAGSFVIDARVCAIGFLLSLLAAALSSLLPALRVARGDLSSVMKDGGGAGFRRSALRTALVVAQVALSVLLVVGTGLFVKSLEKIQSVDIGYDRSRTIMVNADPARAGFDGVRVGHAFDAMSEVARGYPGVETSALAYGEPFGWSMARRLRVAGRDSLPRFTSGGPYIQSVTADYFRTMGLTIVKGRGFADADRREEPTVALLGASMARRYFGADNPIGQCLLLGKATTCTEVIGVVEDGIRHSPQENPQALYYVPLAPSDSTTRHLTLFVRTRDDARTIVAGLQKALQTAVPDLPYVQAQSLEEVLAPRYEPFRLGSTLFGLFGTVSLALAALGIYSVLAYAVRGRQRELGVRVALGATPGSLVSLVLRDGLVLVGLGVVLGLGGAVVGGRVLASLLYGVKPSDLPVLLLSGAVLLLAAVAASLLPARRAARVDPMLTLRTE